MSSSVPAVNVSAASASASASSSAGPSASPSPSDSPCGSPGGSPSGSPQPPPEMHLPVSVPSLPSVNSIVANTTDKSPEDPSMRLSKQRVAEARADTSGRVYRVYCDGVFDLFHMGHARMLEQAKKSLGDPAKVYLLAGVCSDEDVHRYKGKTVMDHKIRTASVTHCKWVDETLSDAPWVIEDAYLTKHHIDFVAHDAIPYQDNSGVAADAKDVYAHVKKRGMFLETQRTEGLSTSDIIVQILRDYDEYVVRNLDRGYTKKELNIGQSWEVRAKMHETARKVKESVKQTRTAGKEAQDAALAFVSEFNPKYLLRKHSGPNGESGPRYFMSRLKENLPARRNELWHHSVGLACALFQTTRYCLSYVNPFSYCFRKNKYH